MVETRRFRGIQGKARLQAGRTREPQQVVLATGQILERFLTTTEGHFLKAGAVEAAEVVEGLEEVEEPVDMTE